MNDSASGSSLSPIGEQPEDDFGPAAWMRHYQERRDRIVDDTIALQETLDPNHSFDCLAQKPRLTKALFRFFLMKQGVAPSLPISREDVTRVFETARREGNLVSTQKLFPYFMAEVQRRLAEVVGLEIREMTKQMTREDAKHRKNAKLGVVYYVQSLLPKEIQRQMIEPKEKEMLAVIGILIRLIAASEGQLTKTEAMGLLGNLDFREGVYHPTFGKWESTIFNEALKRRFIIASRNAPDVYELGEAAFLEVKEEDFPQIFSQCVG